MRSLQSSLSTRLQSIKESQKSKAQFDYQALGEEIRDYFHCKTSSFWFLFHQVELWKIQKAFKECQKQGLGIKDLIRFSKSIK